MDQNLGNLSKKELLAIAKEKGLKGVSAWTKEQLASKLDQLLKPLRKKSSLEPAADEPARKPEAASAEAPKVKVVPKARPAKAAKGKKALEASKSEAKTAVAVGAGKDDAAKASGAEPEVADVTLEATDELLEETSDAKARTRADKKPGKRSDQKVDEKAKPVFKKTTRRDDLLAVDEDLGELPAGYDEDRAVLLVRDPYWVFAYWDLSRSSLEAADRRGDYRQILRVQELAGFGTDEPASFYDVPVPKAARSWYLRLPGDGRRYRVEIALQHRDGGYSPIARSNAVEVPRGEPSEVVADRFVTLPGGEEQLKDRPSTALPPVAQWDIAIAPLTSEAPLAIEPNFPAAPLGTHRPAFGPRLSGPWSGEMPWALRPEAQAPAGPLPGTVGSQSVGSWSFGASENRFGEARKDFWLIADAELIVYGATEPDAQVTLRGDKIDLRPDGTFSFRFYLPDGDHPIPITALNADGDDQRMITLSVSRVTTGDPRVNMLARSR